MSVAIFLLLVSGVLIQAYRELSEPGAWDYWNDRYFSPSMTSSVADNVDLGGRRHQALVLRGKIGAASASWFRERLDEAKLRAGDAIVISSLGGDVGQSLIMGEVIRARGLVTAVGTVDASGRVGPASCASACVFVFAGGKTRFGVEGSRLGVHRFTTQNSQRRSRGRRPARHRDDAQLSHQDGDIRLGLRRGDVADRRHPLAEHARRRCR